MPATGLHLRAEVRHLQCGGGEGVGVGAQSGFDAVVDLAPIRSRTGRTAASLLSSAVVQAAATSGSSATTRAKLRSACCTLVNRVSLTSVK